jgi:hypothetical protein
MVLVRVGPASPRCNTKLRIVHDLKGSQWNGLEYLHCGNGHQANVLATKAYHDGLCAL